jgi:steroid delta-isomerase-like uncharacterized protein
MSGETLDAAARNRAVVRRFVQEVWTNGNLDAVDDLFTADSVLHDPDGDIEGPAALREYNRAYLEAFPDLEYDIEDMLAAGDRVAFRARLRGTHRGEFRGVPATGESFDATGIVIARLENGRIAERWASFDALGMLQQLGLLSNVPGDARMFGGLLEYTRFCRRN